MSSIVETFEKMSRDFKRIAQDAENLDPEKPNILQGVTLSKGVQPVTRLRSSVEEVKSAQENPEIQEILDEIDDAFS